MLGFDSVMPLIAWLLSAVLGLFIAILCLNARLVLSKFLIFGEDSFEYQGFSRGDGFRIEGLRWISWKRISLKSFLLYIRLNSESKDTPLQVFLISRLIRLVLWILQWLVVDVELIEIRVKRSDRTLVVRLKDAHSSHLDPLHVSIVLTSLDTYSPMLEQDLTASYKSGTLKLATTDLHFKLDLLDLIVFASLKSPVPSPDLLLDALFEFVFPVIVIEPIDKVTVTFCLPTLSEAESLFERIEISAKQVSLDRNLSQLNLKARQIDLIAHLKECPSMHLNVFCRADKLLEQTLYEQGDSFKLFEVTDFEFMNHGFKPDFAPAIDFFSQIGIEAEAKKSGEERILSLSASGLRFELPFQFPFGSLIEHLVLLFKAPSSASIEDPMRLFHHTWALRIQVQRVYFSIQDDPFDAKLDRMVRARSAFQNTRQTLIDDFNVNAVEWKTVGAQRVTADALLKSAGFEGKVDVETREALLVLQNALFSTYKARLEQERSHDRLLEIEARDLSLQVSWHKDFLEPEHYADALDEENCVNSSMASRVSLCESFVKLLAALESTQETINVTQLDTNLGGFLSLELRDFDLKLRKEKLVHIPSAKAQGSLFLCEMRPWGVEATQRIAVTYKDFELSALRSAMSLSIYRALDVELSSKAELSIGLRTMLGPLAADLDRALDLLSRPSLDQSPPLSVTDKLRYVFRGWRDRVYLREGAQISIFFSRRDAFDLEPMPTGIHLSEDPREWQERMIVELESGTSLALSAVKGEPRFELTLKGGKLTLEQQSACMSVALGVLRERIGENAFEILSLPACTLTLGCNLKSRGTHTSVLPRVRRPEVDSFEAFRAHSIDLDLRIKLEESGVLSLTVYRQLEDWIRRRFLKIQLDPIVKRGPIWTIPVCVLEGKVDSRQKPRLTDLLSRFSMSVSSSSGLNIRESSWTPQAQLTGLSLSCVQGDVSLAWTKREGQWDFTQGSGSLQNVKLEVLINSQQESKPILVSNHLNYNLVLKEHSTSVHRIVVKEVSLSWDKELRDAIYRLVDNQLQTTIRTHARSWRYRNNLIQGLSPKSGKGTSGRKKSLAKNESVARVELLEKLMKEAEEKGPLCFEGEDRSEGIDARWCHELDLGELLQIPSVLEIEFLEPRLELIEGSGLIHLKAARAYVEHCQIMTEHGPLGRRTVVELSKATFYDTLNTSLTDPATLVLVLDFTSSRYEAMKVARISKAPDALTEGRDAIHVTCDKLSLSTTPEQWQLILSLITNLLVYRDPAQAERSEKRETLVVAATRLEGRQQGFQTSVDKLTKDLESSILSYLLSGSDAKHLDPLNQALDDLALIVDALGDARDQWDRLSQRQTRLDLDVQVHVLRWSLKEEKDSASTLLCEASILGAHDHWCSLEDASETNRISIRSLHFVNKLSGAFYTAMLRPLSSSPSQPPVITAFWHYEIGSDGLDLYRQVQIDVAPLKVQLTHDIVGRLIQFFFPTEEGAQKASATIEPIQELRRSESSLILNPELVQKAQELRQRSSTHAHFRHVIVHSTHHVLSYKGRGDSSFLDLDQFTLKLPTFEYGNQTWSWLDFTLQLRRDAIKVVWGNLGSLVKEKFRRLGLPNTPEDNNSEETTKPASDQYENERIRKLLLGKAWRPTANKD